jgi:hypothetical protein
MSKEVEVKYDGKSVTGAKLQACVTVDMIRIKTRKDYV